MTVEPVDYGRFVSMAERLITRWGQTGTLSRPTRSGPSHNPTPGAPETCAARYVVTEYADRQIDGTRIKSGDKQVLVSPVITTAGMTEPLELNPSVSDSLIEAGGGPALKIIDVEVIKPAAVVVLYVLQCRR